MSGSFLLLNSFIFVINLYCATGPGSKSGVFLKIPSGARPVSIGEAFVAVADDANTINWNIAGLTNISKIEFYATHIKYFQSINYESLNFVYPFKNFVLGSHIGYLYTDKITRTIVDLQANERLFGYQILDSYDASDKTTLFGIAKNIRPTTSVGFGVRYLEERIDTYKANTLSLDFGIFGKISENLSYGVSLQNFGGNLKFVKQKAPVVKIYRFGVGRKIKSLLYGFEVDYSDDLGWQINTGGEYNLFNFVFLRAGWRFKELQKKQYLGNLTGGTAGFGIRFLNYQIDYGFVFFGDLGQTHRISLSGRF